MATKGSQSTDLGHDAEFLPGDFEESGSLWRDLVSRFQWAVVSILALGPVPKHVCLVPDGHRRFSRAASTDLRKVYAIGAQKYFRLREWCFRAGVEVLNVFMFSVRNFSRNSFEMNAALNQANQIHVDVVDNVDVYRDIGMWASACGDLERLPEELRTSLARAEIATSSSSDESLKRQVSCAAYNTKNQMSRMALDLAQAVKDGAILSEDITAEFFDEYVAVTECPEAEMLLRSAGDQRFSDFQVLQCNYAYFHLDAKKWAAVVFMDWIWAILHFQLQWPKIQAIKARHSGMSSYGTRQSDPEQVIRQRTFLRHVQAAKILNIERLAGLRKAVACH